MFVECGYFAFNSLKRLILLFSCQTMSDCFVISWTVAHQVPLSMGFPRQEYWSDLPFSSPGALPAPGIEPKSPALAGGFFTTEPPGKPNKVIYLQGKGKWPQQTPLKDAQDPGPAGLCRGCTEQGALAPPGHRHLPEATTTQPRSLWGEHTA